LNDPNFDLTKSRPPSFSSAETRTKKDIYESSDVDAESQFDSDRYSTSRADSQVTTIDDFDDESPYPEVRASVSSIDDPTMPVNTFRVWFLGMFFVLLTSGLNEIFGLRYPSIFLSGNVTLLLAFPCGLALAKILPTKRFRTFGYVWSLNPGPFNIKEHVCITVMANISGMGAYSTEVVLVQQVFYNQVVPLSYQILLAVSSQVVGYSIGGALRQFVVWPSNMIWPGALVNSALFNTLHKTRYGKADRHLSRQRFFLIALVCSFIWYWIPGYLFTGLSMFNWVCWIAPNNLTVNTLFGTATGLGMSVLTFDWSMISFIGSPLVTPWWAQLNTGASFIFFFWIITPILYFTNTLNFAFFPISSTEIFDNTGASYNVSNIITGGIFDQAKYEAYSPVFLPVTRALSYALALSIFPSIVVHTYLWFRRDIARRFRLGLRDAQDVHSRLMQVYPEVPLWWYILVGVVSFALFCVSIEIFPTRLPIWAAVFGVVVSSFIALPLAILQAITNQQLAVQVLDELVAGYILPGRPIANTIFKTISLMTSNQAVAFAGDLKLGHYMKVPPRMMFSIQMISTVVACVWVILIQNWMVSNIEDICSHTQSQGFVCPGTTTFATSSVVWGAVGPSRIFSVGAPYANFLWLLPIGAIAPIPLYFLARRFPLSFWRFVNVPMIFAGAGGIPPASGINYVSWLLVGFIFNFCIRRMHFRWWMRYNYILSAALDAGLVLSMAVIFFTLQVWTPGGVNINWWGNNVWMNTADANGIPLKPFPASGTIGPSTWS